MREAQPLLLFMVRKLFHHEALCDISRKTCFIKKPILPILIYIMYQNLTLRFTLAGIILSASGYLFLFGQSGYFTITELRKDIRQVNSVIAELRRENQELNEKYILLKESGDRETRDSDTASEAIILKFDKYRQSAAGKDSASAALSSAGKMEQIRILYGFAAFTIIVTGAFIFQRLRQWKFS